MKYLLGFVCALALGAAGCGGEQHPAHHGGDAACKCDHKAGEHCEHCKDGACKCDHKAGEHCEHCKDGACKCDHKAGERCEHCKGKEGGCAHCDGKKPHAHGDHHHGEQGAHHEAETKGVVGELHAVLAPVWHDTSADRLAKACDQAKAMQDKAAAVETAAPPEGANADGYKAAAKELTGAGSALGAACAAPGRPEVEAKFSAFHDAFHKVAEAISGRAHGEHHHH